MILLNVSLAAQQGQDDAVRSLLLDTMTASQAEDGCILYRFTADLTEPGVFHLVEMWRDEAALVAHLKGPVLQGFIERLQASGTLLSSTAWRGDMSPYQVPR